jgi:hypothetical protein
LIKSPQTYGIRETVAGNRCHKKGPWVNNQLEMKPLVSVLLGIACAVAFAQGEPEKGSHIPSQAAADVLREFAGTDGAFLAAGLVRSGSQQDDLASLLQYPTDELVVVTLTGTQVMQAFERSLALYPQANSSFLQISGFEVVFVKDAPVGKRVKEARCNNLLVQESKEYQIAMPSLLGRGGLGYFKIWDKAKITKTFDKATVESVLKGKKVVESAPRWVASS